MKRVLSLLLVLMMVICVFAGCGGDADNGNTNANNNQNVQKDPNAGTPLSETPMYMQWYQAGGVETSFENPHCGTNSLYPYMVYEPLSALNTKTGERYWRVAESMELSDDLKTVTINVRQGVKWHDGQPVTVDDVVFSIQAALANPQSGQKNNFIGIPGASAFANGDSDTIDGLQVDGNSIILTYAEAKATLLNDVGNLLILPKHCFPENVDFSVFNSYDYWKFPIGCGPYKITEVVFPDYFKVTRFDGYFGEQPGIKNVVFKYYGTTDAGLAAAINGEIDFGTRQLVTDKTVADNIIQQNSNFKVVKTSGYYYRWFRFQLDEREDGMEKALLHDKEVRLAMDLIIDNDAMASVYGDMAEGIDVLFSPADPNYPHHLKRESQNIDKALEILNRKGWDFEDELNIVYYQGDQTTHDLMQFVKQCFDRAGVKCTVYYTDSMNTDPVYVGRNFDLLFVGGNAAADYPAVQYLYLTSYQTSTIGAADERRERGYDDIYKKYDSCLGEERIKYAHQLMEMDFEDCYQLPAFTLNNCIIYNNQNISIPEGVFEMESTTYMQWEDWRVLN